VRFQLIRVSISLMPKRELATNVAMVFPDRVRPYILNANDWDAVIASSGAANAVLAANIVSELRLDSWPTVSRHEIALPLRVRLPTGSLVTQEGLTPMMFVVSLLITPSGRTNLLRILRKYGPAIKKKVF
jgi:hypothetical protein